MKYLVSIICARLNCNADNLIVSWGYNTGLLVYSNGQPQHGLNEEEIKKLAYDDYGFTGHIQYEELISGVIGTITG